MSSQPEAPGAQSLGTKQQIIDDFVDLLSVEELDTDLFHGARLDTKTGHVFGGQVVAQALAAAEQSVEDDRIPHSLHAYFMRPGDEKHPILYKVERDRDGRSFSTRRVIAQQHGKPILSAAINFHVPEQGMAHQIAMPDAPAPEDLPNQAEMMREQLKDAPERMRRMMSRPRPVEMRPVYGFGPGDRQDKGDPAMMVWFKPIAPLPDNAAVHRWALAHTSDSNLLGPAMRPHGVSWQTPGIQATSLDHALWLHEDFRMDDWLLYVADSPWSGNARGMSIGRVFTRDGQLIASSAQEGLIRLTGDRAK